MDFKSGFIGIVGPSNSGKSTLLNALVGQKVSIVSKKPQTTMRSVRGIVHGKDFQFAFVDTPGLGERASRSEPLMRSLNQLADKQARGCDLLLWVFDVSKKYPLKEIERFTKDISEWKDKAKSICILNKVDLVYKPHLLPIMEAIIKKDIFSDVIPVSAIKGVGTDRITSVLRSVAEDSTVYYGEKDVTDRPPEFFASEFVREKIYELMHAELPYSVWVEVEKWDNDQTPPMVYVAIHVDTDSRKRMIIGRQGQKIKEIGIRARKEIQRHIGHKICLKLHVNVQANWKRDPSSVNRYLELQ